MLAFESIANAEEPTLFVQFEEQYCSEAYLLDALQHKFSFNGESYDLGNSIDWQCNPSADVEWHILLHKFYVVPGLIRRWLETGEQVYLDGFRSLVSSWIAQSPSNYIASDVTARRVQNWAYAWSMLRDSGSEAVFEADFVALMQSSVESQIEGMLADLAPARNHRTLELYALLVAGIAFAGSERADSWRTLAWDELVKNMRRDLQGDGVHCEQSTHYHHIVLKNYLLAYRLALKYNLIVPMGIEALLCKALDFALYVQRPDGSIPALSDSDSGDFRFLLAWGAELFERADYAYGASLGAHGSISKQASRAFLESGYAVLRSSWGKGVEDRNACYLILDAGPIGEGNHGHFDALSVEISAFGRQLVVDPGRFTYDEGGEINWRNRFRASTAHNTVTVDNLDQGILRRKHSSAHSKVVAPLPRTRLLEQRTEMEPAFLHGVANSPNYRPIHHRYVWFARERYWLIVDWLANDEPANHDFRLRYQLAMSAQGSCWLTDRRERIELKAPGLDLNVIGTQPLSAEIENGWVAPTYGDRQLAPRLCVGQRARQVCFVSVLCPNPLLLADQYTYENCQLTHVQADQGAITIYVRVGNRVDQWVCQPEKQIVYRSDRTEQQWSLTDESSCA